MSPFPKLSPGQCLCILTLSTACFDVDPFLEDAPCPCLDGNVCCPSTQRCVETLDVCPPAATLRQVVPSRGAVGGGFAVELLGSGLELALEVSFGGAPCPVLERGQARLRCLLPPGPPEGGSVDVTLSLGGQIEARLVDGFSYETADFEEVGETSGILGSGLGPGVSIADLDRDGHPDLAFSVLNFFLEAPFEVESQVFVQTDSRFERLFTETVWRHGAILPADISGDGHPELLLSADTPTFFQSLTRSSTTAPFSTSLELRGSERIDYAPVPIDLEGDGDLDLVGCYNDVNGDEMWVRVMVNDGGELAFDDTRAVNLRFSNLRCGVTNVGDLDQDGRPELLFCGDGLIMASLDDRGRVLINERFYIGFDFGGRTCTTAAVRDLDLDGDMDVALGFEGNVNVFDSSIPETGLLLLTSPQQQTGSVVLEEAGPLELPSSASEVCDGTDIWEQATLPFGIGASLWFDIDLDGDEDVLLPTPAVRCGLAPGAYLSLAAQETFAYSYRSFNKLPILGSAPGGALADLDGDGDLDAVVSNGLVGRRAIFSNRARQTSGVAHHFVTLAPLTDPDGDATDSNTQDDRPAWSVVVQLDLGDGGFAPGPNLRTRVVGDSRSNRSHSYPEVLFGLGARNDPVWVRVYFADGSMLTRQVEIDERWTLRDCADPECP